MNTTPADQEHIKGDVTRAKKAAAVAASQKETVAELHTLIQTELATIRTKLGVAHQFHFETRPPSAGLVTAGAKTAMSDLVATEKRDRIRITTNPDPVRRQWMSPTATGTGPVPIPGSVATYSIEAEATMVLRQIATTINTRLTRAGVCYLHNTRLRYLNKDLDRKQVIHPLPVLITMVEDLVNVTTNTTHLRSIHRDLEDLTSRVLDVADGPGKAIPPNPTCPLCHRPTLIAELHTYPQTVRCDRDQTTGRLHPCRCDDQFCSCTRKPSFRHTWANIPRNTKVDLRWTWMGLHDHQNRWHRATSTPTRRHPVNPQTTPDLVTDPHHRFTVAFTPGSPPTYQAHCTAPKGAECRQTYACFLDEHCDPTTGTHQPTCQPTLGDLDYCNVVEWLNSDHVEYCGTATITVPIAPTWNGDNYGWATNRVES